MVPTSLRIWVVALLVAVAAATKVGPAWAETEDKAEPKEETEAKEETLNKIIELNKKALLAYDALDVENASTLLHRALHLCKASGLEDHPVTARTHLHLGVVYISGLKFPELGEAEFRDALAIDPKIHVPKSLLNPEVQAAFDDALWWETGPKGNGKPLPFPTGKEWANQTESDRAPGVDVIGHPIVTHANKGEPIEIKAHIPPGMGATKIVLAYMAQDSDQFLAREMKSIPSMPGWYHEFIPVEAAQGAWVAYYIEARDAEDQPLSQNGNAEDPHHVELGASNSLEARPPSEQPPRSKTDAKDAGGRSLWFVFALGSGGGYHRGSPEMNPTDFEGRPIEDSGFGVSELLHVAPEIGYFHRNDLILSAQARIQYVTGTQAVQIGRKRYEPALLAFAGLLKATWLSVKPGNRFQAFVNVQAGVGQIRHSITTPEEANLRECGPELTCKDTVLGGLAFVGTGAGFRFLVSQGLGLYAAINLLTGVPRFLLNADLNLGVAIVR